MGKIVFTDLANLQSETTAVQTINANFAKIASALDTFLSRDGANPNFLTASLDLNSNRILNLPKPLTDSEPLRLADVGGIAPSDIQNAGTYAANAAASAAAAAASATAAAGYVGAATNAPKWTTPRVINVYGDISGASPAWDGSTDLNFAGITLVDGAVTASKLAVGAAVSNLGFTPVNKGGDTLTGDLAIGYVAASLSAQSIGFRGIPINNQNTAYSFAIDDVGRMIRHTSGTAHAWTINPTGTTNFPVGAAFGVRNVGAGSVTLTRGPGVALRKAGTSTDADVTLAQWGYAALVHEDTNVWVVSGVGIT